MKKIFERWEDFKNNERAFEFSEEEMKQLSRSVSKIVTTAQKVLGAEGPIPSVSHFFTKTTITKPVSEPFSMVAEDEEQEKLRQKYYGPGGELEKRGPKSVKGLKKGIGKMSAEEWEETGFVMKVPQEVLEDFALLVEGIKKTGELYVQARDWYHNIRKLIDEETGTDRDAALMGMLIAVYSPRAKFALNLAEAVFMFKAVQKDAAQSPERLKQYLETFPGTEKLKPGEPRGFTKAHKVPNFTLNIIAPQLSGYRSSESGEMVYNDMYMWNSTIDTWMIDAFYPMLKKASTSKEWEAIKGKLMSNVVSYRYMSQLVAQEARRLGILPHELQAIIWVAMQVKQTGDPGLGVTTQFAFDQIKESIANIRQINNDLEDIRKEFSQKSWLGILFSEIEQKGFEEAEKFILGIKDEKGKIVAPGVRSVTSRGKKGDMFRYYPEPEGEKTGKKKKVFAPASKPKAAKRYTEEEYSDLYTHYVMNKIIQMPTGKFNNLYDSITLYLDSDFSTEKAVSYILGRFDPEALSTKEYFREWVRRSLF